MTGNAQLEPETRFAFGENWSSYARNVGDEQLDWARRGMDALVGAGNLASRRFLDIGCGSGVHAVAALRLGAASVLAVDYDPRSVATTKAVLARHAVAGASYEVRQADVLAMDPADFGRFDVVYSWGVLHHTGAMRQAIARAAGLVAPGGLLAIALYRKTYLCPFWRWEKWFYCRSGAAVQRTIRTLYLGLYRLALRAKGRDFAQFLAEYKRNRGMDFDHDVNDWLGGYPYESTDQREVDALMRSLGFAAVRSNVQGKHVGLFGSGCDEYLYRKA